MMESPQINSSVKDFGSCALCGLKLCSATKPQLLPCLHSLCRDCFALPDTIKDPECPVCQEKYKLQDVVSNLVFGESSSVPKESIACGGCEESSVAGWCVECQESLCAVCVAAHQRVKVARQHFVHTITPEFPRPVVCPIHKKMQVNNYCVTCDQLTCRHCLPFHLNHLLQDVPGAVLWQRRQIRRMVQKVHCKRQAAQKSLTDLESRLSHLKEVEIRVRLDVKTTVVNLCNVIVKKAAKLLKEMEDLCGKEREKLADQKVMLQHLHKKQEHVLAFTDKVLGSQDHTVLSCKKQICHQLQHLLEQNVFSNSPVMELNFQYNQANVKKALKAFGCIVAKETPSASYQMQNLPDQTSEVLTPTQSPGKPKAPFQTPSPFTESSSHSANVPQFLRTHDLPTAIPPSQKSSNPPIRARLCLDSSPQYSNCPKQKRPWSYHPYDPDSVHLSQTIIKSLTQKDSLSSSRSSTSQQHPSIPSSSLCASAPASPVLCNKPQRLTLPANPLAGAGSTPTSSGKTTNNPSVDSPQNNGCLYGVLLKRSNNLSPAEPNSKPLNDVQTSADSTCLSKTTNGSVKIGQEMLPMLTVPDEAICEASSPNPVLIHSKQAEEQKFSQPVTKLEFNTSPSYHCFPSESSSTKVASNSSAGLVNTNSSISASFPLFCIKINSSTGTHEPLPPDIMSSGSDDRRVEANSWLPTTQRPSAADSQLKCPSHQETAVVSPQQGTSDLHVLREESLEESLKTSLLTKDSLHSLSASHIDLPKGTLSTHLNEVTEGKAADNNTMSSNAELNDILIKIVQNSTQTSAHIKEEMFDAGVGLAVPDLTNSYCFPLEEEDNNDDPALIKIRDNEGNFVVLEPLGRDWLPDVTVCRLPIPRYASSSPAPVFYVLRREGSNDSQLRVTHNSEQFPALHPVLISEWPDASCPLLAKKLNCAACKVSGKLFQCCVCHRAFHGECHIPPMTSVTNTKRWQCLLCRDLSHIENLELYPECNDQPILSLTDQRKCEYLLLALICNTQSSTLYRSVKMLPHADHYVDATLVRGRLLRKLTPPYRKPAEFVSDIWLLLSSLLSSAQESQRVKGLQRFFSKELRRVFGQSLHPSLLKDPFRGERKKIATPSHGSQRYSQGDSHE